MAKIRIRGEDLHRSSGYTTKKEQEKYNIKETKPMSKLEELKAQLELKKAEKKAEMEVLIEQRKVETQLQLLDTPFYQNQMVSESNIKTLDGYIAIIEERYAENKRKLSPTFGFGVVANKILTIIKAIQYAKADEKEEFLIMTGLSEQLVEEIVDALGNTAYFSVRELTIVDEQPCNIVALQQGLQIAGTLMQLVGDVPVGKVNQDNIDRMYASARARAEEMLENTLKYNDTEVAYTE